MKGAGRQVPGAANARVLTMVLAVLSAGSLAGACLLGPMPIPAHDALAILAGHADGVPEAWVAVVRDIRLSRVCLSWLVGAALAVSGAVFQGILRNPLADPFTLGVSGGAAFGASLAIFLGIGGAYLLPGLGPLPLAALVGGIAALAVVVRLGSVGGRLRRETLVLAGIVVATFLAALISLIKSLDEEAVAGIVFWIMGSFQGRGWSHVTLFLPQAALGGLVVWRFARELDILALGETQAVQLGMPAARVRTALLVGASLLTAAAVAVSGVIGFVGLVVPHVVRLVQGAEHRALCLNAALAGGVLLLWSDVLARTVLPQGAELPVGVVTALLGGPFFCLLLRRRAAGRLDGV